jgi:hypothetical protein
MLVAQLLPETGGWTGVALGALAVAGTAYGLVKQYKKDKDERAEKKRLIDSGQVAGTIEQWKALAEQQKARWVEEREEGRKQIEELREDYRAEVEKCKQERDADRASLALALDRLARAETRLESHEEALTRRNIPFRPWRPDPPAGDSGTHRPLPPGEKP